MAARLKVHRLELERAGGRTLSWEEFFGKLLEEKKPEAQAKRKTKSFPQGTRPPEKLSRNNQKPSRHIPAAIKREVENRSEGLCEYPDCFKPAEHFHHADRFALNGTHRNIRNLCKAHHELAHQGLIAEEELAPDKWKLQLFPDLLEPKFEVDRLVRKNSTFR